MKLFKKLLMFLIVLFIPLGFSSFIIEPTLFSKITGVSGRGEYIDVKVHNIKSTIGSTSIEYFIPETNAGNIVVNESAFLSPNGLDGSKAPNEKYKDELGSGWQTISYDEKQGFYNISENGDYTLVDTQSGGATPYNIKNKQIQVNNWKQVQSGNERANVWDVGYGDNKFYYYSNCEDNMSFKSKYKKGDVVGESEKLVSKVGPIFDETTGVETTEEIYERVVVRDLKEVRRGKKKKIIFTFYYIYGFYFPTFQYRKVVTKKKVSQNKIEDSDKMLKVVKGTTLNDFKNDIPNFEFVNYYKDPSFKIPFKLNEPINTSCDIYLKYNENPELDNSLTHAINSFNNQSESVFEIYDSNRGGKSASTNSFNVALDSYYEENTKSVILKSEVINSGKTLNLLYGESKIYETPLLGQIKDGLGNHRTKTDSAVSPFYKNSSYIKYDDASLYLLLKKDLRIKGTVNIGGHIGGNESNLSLFSYIIGKYACIDLNGHKITVDGGTLNNYGLIVDSYGGGSIEVINNGSVTGVMTVTDGRPIREGAVALGKRQTPFTDYRFLGFQVPLKIVNGSSFKSYLKYDLGEYYANGYQFSFIGNSTDNALLQWVDADKTSYIDFVPLEQETDDTTLRMNSYNIRNQLRLNANVKQYPLLTLPFKIDLTIASVEATIDFSRIDFPISPFFDLYLCANNTLEITSLMTFYPGSSFYSEKNSIVRFNYLGEIFYKDISTMGVVAISGEKRYLAGGFVTYDNRISDLAARGINNENFSRSIYSNTQFWKTNMYSNFNIGGDVSFNQNINTGYVEGDGYYILSGQINLSKKALISLIENRNYLKTYYIKGELGNGFFYSGANIKMEDTFIRAHAYNCSPLVSNNRAYIIDNNNCVSGDYISNVIVDSHDLSINSNTVVKKATGKKYFLEVSTDMLLGGSNAKNHSNKIDRKVNVSEVETFDSEHDIIKKNNGGFFVLYKGIYIPVLDQINAIPTISNESYLRVNARKFMSNRDSSNQTQNVTKLEKKPFNSNISDSIENASFNSFSQDINQGICGSIKFLNGSSANISSLNNSTSKFEFASSQYGSLNIDIQSNDLIVTDNLKSSSDNLQINLVNDTTNGKGKIAFSIEDKTNANSIVNTTIEINLTTSVSINMSLTDSSNIYTLNFSGGRTNNQTIQISKSGIGSKKIQLTSTNYIHGYPLTINTARVQDDLVLKFLSKDTSWWFKEYGEYPRDNTKDIYYSY